MSGVGPSAIEPEFEYGLVSLLLMVQPNDWAAAGEARQASVRVTKLPNRTRRTAPSFSREK